MTAAHWLLEETLVANEGGWEGSGWAEGPWPNRGIVSQAESGTLWAMRPGSYRLEAESILCLSLLLPFDWLAGFYINPSGLFLTYQPVTLMHHFGSRHQHDPPPCPCPAALRIKAGFLTKQLLDSLLMV